MTTEIVDLANTMITILVDETEVVVLIHIVDATPPEIPDAQNMAYEHGQGLTNPMTTIIPARGPSPLSILTRMIESAEEVSALVDTTLRRNDHEGVHPLLHIVSLHRPLRLLMTGLPAWPL